MVPRSAWLLLTSLSAVLLACSASFGPGSEVWVPDSASVLVRSAYSGITDARSSVISDSAAWQAAWSDLSGGGMPVRSVPAVDFSAQSVLLVAMGSRPSGAYSISIDSLARWATRDTVFVTGTSPGSRCIVTAALTAPVEAVVTPWPVGAAAWRTTAVTQGCP